MDRIKTIPEDYEGKLGILTIKESSTDQQDFVPGETFTITLPEEVDWDEEKTRVYFDGRDITSDNAGFYSNELEIDFSDLSGMENQNTLEIHLAVICNDITGDIKINIQGENSGVSNGEFIVGRIDTGKANAKLTSSPNNIVDQGYGATILIYEAAPGSLGTLPQKLQITLPEGFSWGDMQGEDQYNQKLVKFTRGFRGITSKDIKIRTTDPRTLFIDFTPAGDRSLIGEIEIKPLIYADKNAPLGPVEVSVEGNKVDKTVFTVAQHLTSGVSITADTLPTLLAGSYNQEEEIKLTVKENAPGILIPGRIYRLTLPSKVKLTGIQDISSYGEYNVDLHDWDEQNIEISIDRSSREEPGEISLDFKLSLAADMAQDINITISGSGLTESSFPIAKVLPPLRALAEPQPLKLGQRNQPVKNITLSEGKAEAIARQGDIIIKLPSGVTWSQTPQVLVTGGGLELSSITTDGRDLIMTVKETSYKVPANIVITGIMLDIGRMVPEGPIVAQVTGDALVQNYHHDSNKESEGEFNQDSVAEITLGQINTIQRQPVVYFLGLKEFYYQGKVITMDTEPELREGQIFIPLRHLAQGLGFNEQGISYQQGCVTLQKGQHILKICANSPIASHNDTPVNMAASPYINNQGRLMVPLLPLAEIMGIGVKWENNRVEVFGDRYNW